MFEGTINQDKVLGRMDRSLEYHEPRHSSFQEATAYVKIGEKLGIPVAAKPSLKTEKFDIFIPKVSFDQVTKLHQQVDELLQENQIKQIQKIREDKEWAELRQAA